MATVTAKLIGKILKPHDVQYSIQYFQTTHERRSIKIEVLIQIDISTVIFRSVNEDTLQSLTN